MNKELKYACTNCGRQGHEYKYCRAPITSWGIILVKLNGISELDHSKLNSNELVEINNNNEQLISSSAFSSIQFLMISRKHSIGYMEFVRGRYKPYLIDKTMNLFKQMTQPEIDKVKQSLSMDRGFEFLWNDVWKDHMNGHLCREKIEGQKNYDSIKYVGKNSPEISLEFIVDNVKPEYKYEEWGFPKGRRNRNETELECAIREFKEETGLMDTDFKIINEIQPLKETFNGTNGIKYSHVYYVAEMLTDKIPVKDATPQQQNEIGNICFFNFQTALMYIREYHTERKELLKKLLLYYIKTIILNYRAGLA